MFFIGLSLGETLLLLMLLKLRVCTVLGSLRSVQAWLLVYTSFAALCLLLAGQVKKLTLQPHIQSIFYGHLKRHELHIYLVAFYVAQEGWIVATSRFHPRAIHPKNVTPSSLTYPISDTLPVLASTSTF